MRGIRSRNRVVGGLLAVTLTLASGLSACGTAGDTLSGTPSDTVGGTLSSTSDDTPLTAGNLTAGIQPQTVTIRQADDGFLNGVAQFSVALFQQSRTAEQNCLLSPLSALVALSMTANGADGETLRQMEQTLCGGIPIAQLNEYLHTYLTGLPDGEESQLELANSLWAREGAVQLRQSFLQANANYYAAPCYAGAFDASTVKAINDWVSLNTDGRIDTLLEEIPEEAVLYLLNAVVLDAQWERLYEEQAVTDGVFHAVDGDQPARLMHSCETAVWDGDTPGFLKPYAGGRYAFLGLLPEKGALETYIDSLTGERLREIVGQATSGGQALVSLPQFSQCCELELNGPLQAMGMMQAFDVMTADLSRIGETRGGDRLFISRVFQKTFIEVDEKGTRAAAVTAVEVANESMPQLLEFDRPFVYAIVDLQTGLPLFLGTVQSLENV